ncbi:TetR family transcriptional regulator [Galbitalea sp. SE-J8]|uniref:TetR/AcrR family transcriptional regulator n=1 Tax=Galbitalea sp. SE-J8 TaxID=3054952 RepID=UPI00259CF30D|nr:TetR family transcriptional regulator [Galbitalea sp. SE-J8]MDM4764424.1 TetR family transcriptional regulator [Galbitalea sp. SE-J8]
MDAAVRVIAREGSHGLSFAKVVEEGGLSSTRLISYHFGSREILLEETLAHVVARAAEFMGPRIAAETSVRGKVRAYITSNFEFLAQNLDVAGAAVDLAASVGGSASAAAISLLEEVFRAGQDAGELRAFDVHVMAIALRGAIDANVLDLHSGNAGAARTAAELSAAFDRAIRV